MTGRTRAAGFTMVELVVVMVIIGALAAIGIPRLMGDKTSEAAIFGDQVVSGLRRAQKIAMGHRRVVCATLEAKAVVLRVNDCGSAGIALNGSADGDYATSDSALTVATGTLYFQPDGRVTQDLAGKTPWTAGIAIMGNVDGQNKTFRTINIQGTTGYVE
jgi:MSHA pilin protein MshC